MTLTRIAILGDNDHSHYVQGALSEYVSAERKLGISVFSQSLHGHCPERFTAAILSRLISVSEAQTDPEWYQHRGITLHRGTALASLRSGITDNKNELLAGFDCIVDTRSSDARIIYHKTATADDSLTIFNADDLMLLAEKIKHEEAVTVYGSSLPAITVALQLAAQGKQIQLFLQESSLIHPYLDGHLQRSLNRQLEQCGIIAGGDYHYPDNPLLVFPRRTTTASVVSQQTLPGELVEIMLRRSAERQLQTAQLGRLPLHFCLPADPTLISDTLWLNSEADNTCRKISLHGNRVAGFALLGDIRGSDRLHALLQSQQDISAIRDQLMFTGWH